MHTTQLDHTKPVKLVQQVMPLPPPPLLSLLPHRVQGSWLRPLAPPSHSPSHCDSCAFRVPCFESDPSCLFRASHDRGSWTALCAQSLSISFDHRSSISFDHGSSISFDFGHGFSISFDHGYSVACGPGSLVSFDPDSSTACALGFSISCDCDRGFWSETSCRSSPSLCRPSLGSWNDCRGSCVSGGARGSANAS